MAAPFKVGILNDMSAGPPGPTDTESWLRAAADEVTASGRLECGVEFINAWSLGLPHGTAAAVERAYGELVEQGVVLIIGPAIGDNALVVTPLTDRHRVPTIHWAGAERARGDWMFHLQVGSHEDESIVLARYLARLGARRLGILYDQSPIGTQHLRFLKEEAAATGLVVDAAAALAPLAEEAASQVDQVLACGPDAIVYLGLGLSAPAVARALTERGWAGLKAMNTAGLRGYTPEFGRAIDGWVYVDMHSDGNVTLNRLMSRLKLDPGKRFGAAKGHDLGRLMAEGLAHAEQPIREGVRDGLEHVKWLPAAQGHEGTLLGFGIYDRAALHGRYLVLRRWDAGVSIEVDE